VGTLDSRLLTSGMTEGVLFIGILYKFQMPLIERDFSTDKERPGLYVILFPLRGISRGPLPSFRRAARERAMIDHEEKPGTPMVLFEEYSPPETINFMASSTLIPTDTTSRSGTNKK